MPTSHWVAVWIMVAILWLSIARVVYIYELPYNRYGNISDCIKAGIWPLRLVWLVLGPIYRLLSLLLVQLYSITKKWILNPVYEYLSYPWMNAEEKEAFRLKLDLARWKKAEKKSEARAKYHEVRRRNEERRNLRAIEQQGRIQKDISATRARIKCLDLEIYGGEDAESSKGVAER